MESDTLIAKCLRQELILEPAKMPGKQAGCYVINPDYLKMAEGKLLSVPIRHMDYHIEIMNNVAHVTLQQQYENTLPYLLQLQYMFPIEPKACITSFKAKFSDDEIVGVVKEKEQAKKEYKEGLSQGKQVVLGQIFEKSPDIMCLKIGNLAPKTTVVLTIEFMQLLQVSLNTFWRLSVQSVVWPRYLNDPTLRAIGGHSKNFTWAFKIDLKTDRVCQSWSSPSHKLACLDKQPKEISLVLPETEKPTGDFVFVYTTEDFQLPSVMCGKTDISRSCLISLIPKFCELSVSDAEKMQLKGEDYEANIDSAIGQFIFLLDRSGSMQGVRITKAKEALKYFIRSLPKRSYFNVFSFGSDYSTLFPESRLYDDKSMQEALKLVDTYKADMGGTEIAGPLTQIMTGQPIKGYPRNVFLLTDGEVGNTDSIVNLVEQNSKYCRVHGIGIGEGASKALIKGCAEKGKGRSIFIADKQNVAGKIIEMLQGAISPVITDFHFDFDRSLVESIIPNPEQMPYILKNEPLCLYVMFNPGFEGASNFHFSYTDSANQKQFISDIKLTGEQPTYPLIDKMAQHQKIQIACQSLKKKSRIQNDMFVSEVGDLRQYAITQSVKHQILCEHTAFICVGKQLDDHTLQQYPQKKIEQSKEEKLKLQLSSLKKVQNFSLASQQMCLNRAENLDDLMQKSMDLERSSKRFCMASSNLKKKSAGFDLGIGDALGKAADGIKNFFGGLFDKGTAANESRAVEGATIAACSATTATDSKVSQSPQMKEKQQVRNLRQQISRRKNNLFDEEDDDDYLPNQKMKGKKKKQQQFKQYQKEIGDTQEVCLANEKMKKIKTQALINIGDCQRSDGSWEAGNLQQVKQCLNLTDDKIKELSVIVSNNMDLLVTILALHYLETMQNTPENILIIKKAKSWISKESTRVGVAKEQIDKVIASL